MKRNITILLLFCIIALCFETCKIESFQSQWSNQVCNDSCIFKSPLRFYDTNTRLQYSIFNDNKNLYIYIKATENIAQLKILQNGILLKIDSTSKHKKDVSLLYPIPNKSKKKKPIPFDSQSDWDIYVSRFSYDHAYMKITGFKNIKEEEILTNNQFGLSASISWDNIGGLLYKATIPFARFFKDSITVNDSSKVLSLEIALSQHQDPRDASQAQSTTALSIADEKAMKRGNPVRGNGIQQSGDESYLYNIRTLKLNFTPAIIH